MEEKYEYTPLFYATPCQVRFFDYGDAENPVWGYGIANEDYIICGCCGGILMIEEIVEEAIACGIHWDDAVVELEWVDIKDFIKG